MKRGCRGAWLTATLMLAGCAGQVRTVVLPATALAAGTSFTGVVFYQPQFVKQTFAFTTINNAQGAVAGTAAGGDCVQTIEKEIVGLLPDLGRPMLIQNASGGLSAARFSVTLTNGMLDAVNAEPAQKPSDLVSATSSLAREIAGIARLALEEGRPACNASPRLVAFERIELK